MVPLFKVGDKVRLVRHHHIAGPNGIRGEFFGGDNNIAVVENAYEDPGQGHGPYYHCRFKHQNYLFSVYEEMLDRFDAGVPGGVPYRVFLGSNPPYTYLMPPGSTPKEMLDRLLPGVEFKIRTGIPNVCARSSDGSEIQLLSVSHD